MNHKQLSKLALALGAMVMAGGAMAQQSATAAADTEAVVVKPITLTKETDLTFGRLASVAGDVFIAASNGARTSDETGSLVAANGAAEAPGRATFTVAGEAGLTYAISGGTGPINLTSGANTLVVTLTGVWVPSKTGAPGIAAVGTLPAEGGSETLGVGGTLTLADDTPSGTYANTAGISITVNYN